MLYCYASLALNILAGWNRPVLGCLLELVGKGKGAV
jgi:hypothetical protein